MEAYVTLATTDGYALGALVLAHSLKSQQTTKQLCILVTPGVTKPIKDVLSTVFDEVVMVDVLDSNDVAHLALLSRPELGITFTKLHCWSLTQYSKCVFLDADVLAMQNADELFQEPELSAACDVGWPDCFNSGMFVFTPSEETFKALIEHAKTHGSFDGGDQGLLNTFFPKWNRVSFVYNMVASTTYTYRPAFVHFWRDVKLVHFLGSTKPWHGERTLSSCTDSTYDCYLQAWWTIYKSVVMPAIPSTVHRQDEEPCKQSSPVIQPTEHFIPENITPEYSAPYQLATQLGAASLSEDLDASRRRWESGRPDYMGEDSVDNILAYIDDKVKK